MGPQSKGRGQALVRAITVEMQSKKCEQGSGKKDPTELDKSAA